MSANLTAVADILDKAANHIDTVGWHQGELYDRYQAIESASECRVCMLGAINVALHGDPKFPIGRKIAGETDAHDVAAYIERRLAVDDDMATWNDAEGRTQAEVTAALRETAAELRGGGA
jgi:hypothetical protein